MTTISGHMTYHGAPVCRCGSRNSKSIGLSALLRQCQHCGQTYAYRLRDGLLIAFTIETAEALEGLSKQPGKHWEAK
jgi:hypothetical protein